MKKAALFVGGWEGHTPQAFCDWAIGLLGGAGFEVVTHETLAPLEEPDRLADVDLIVPIWSSARSSHQPEFGNMNKAQEDGLLRVILLGQLGRVEGEQNGQACHQWHGRLPQWAQ